MAEDRGTIRVLITSVDGNADHPFRPAQSIGEVRRWAYDKLVSDKGATPFDSTWIEFKGSRIDDSVELDSMEHKDGETGKDPDLVVSLSWISQGGSAVEYGSWTLITGNL